MRWSFDIGIDGEGDKRLFELISRWGINPGLGIADSCSNVQIISRHERFEVQPIVQEGGGGKGRAE